MSDSVISIAPPSDKQKQFLTANNKFIAFGGARGGGKSWAVRQKAKLLAINYPGIRVLVVRRTYPELINNHIRELRGELLNIAKYNDRDKCFTFFNGSLISFSYCANDNDLDRLQGVEFDIIFLDEATQLSEFQMRKITACLRGANDFPKRVYYTCNPGGQGHAYIKRLFIDRRYTDGENPDDYTFIQSLVTDNRALMEAQPDYIKQLEALPPKLRDAWLYGRWDIFEGQFFEEFTDCPEHYRDRHGTHVIAPFEPPPHWTVIRCFDWGYARPFACEWIFVDEAGRFYIGVELYGCGDTPNTGVRWTPDKVFAEIKRVESEHPFLKGRNILGVADPAIWDSQTGESIAETAAKHGVYFVPGDHKRIPGWMQMHYRFSFDEAGVPGMYVFDTCKGFIRTIPLLIYDTVKTEDIDTTGEDHIADAVRYACMSRPIKPRVLQADGFYSSPLHTIFDIDKNELADAPMDTEVIIDGQYI